MSVDLPWFNQISDDLRRQLQQGKLAHASLLVSPEGQGKKQFLASFSKVLLCESASGCGYCKSCQLANTDYHPDLVMVSPQPPSMMIKIDQVRALRDFMQLAPHTSPIKIAVINDIDRMNTESANALLKLLEEPPTQRYLLMSTSRLGVLLPTIKSRAFICPIEAPSASESQAYLEHSVDYAQIDTAAINRAIERFPHAPVHAYDFLIQRGEAVEQEIAQWLYRQIVQKAPSAFPSLAILSEQISESSQRQRTILAYTISAVSQLRALAIGIESNIVASSQDLMAELSKVATSLQWLNLQRALQRLYPQLGQVNVPISIMSIVQAFQDTL